MPELRRVPAFRHRPSRPALRLRSSAATTVSGNHLVPLLLDYRVRNNLGTPAKGNSLTREQHMHLKLVHDHCINLLKQESSERPLSQAQRAQCEYLIGYTHRFLGDYDARKNFQRSFQILPSGQAAAQLRVLQATRTSHSRSLVDLWNEFDEVLSSWTNRSNTACDDCNDICPSCG